MYGVLGCAGLHKGARNGGQDWFTKFEGACIGVRGIRRFNHEHTLSMVFGKLMGINLHS